MLLLIALVFPQNIKKIGVQQLKANVALIFCTLWKKNHHWLHPLGMIYSLLKTN